jgi:hypothetical protein
MKVEFLSGFEKDLSLTHDKVLAKIILDCIEVFEKANKINDVPNIKKLKGAFQYSITH